MINKNLKKCHEKNFFKKNFLKAQASLKTQFFLFMKQLKSPNVNLFIEFQFPVARQKSLVNGWIQGKRSTIQSHVNLKMLAIIFVI